MSEVNDLKSQIDAYKHSLSLVGIGDGTQIIKLISRQTPDVHFLKVV